MAFKLCQAFSIAGFKLCQMEQVEFVHTVYALALVGVFPRVGEYQFTCVSIRSKYGRIADASIDLERPQGRISSHCISSYNPHLITSEKVSTN